MLKVTLSTLQEVEGREKSRFVQANTKMYRHSLIFLLVQYLYTTSRKVADSIPDGVIGVFH